jgi:hypothetical protein
MKQMLHILHFEATYETRASAPGRDRFQFQDPCAVTTSTPKLRPRKRLRFSLRDEKVKGLIWQIVVVGLAVAVVGWL